MKTTITKSAGPKQPPGERELAQKLGRTAALWDRLVEAVGRTHAPVTLEWHLSRTTGTWHVRLKQNGRTILYLLPCEKHFLTAFVFGERAEAAVRAAGLTGAVVQALDESRPCGAGRGIRLVTKSRRDVATMLKLAAIKLAP